MSDARRRALDALDAEARADRHRLLRRLALWVTLLAILIAAMVLAQR